MKIFYWTSETLAYQTKGHLIALADTVEEARQIILNEYRARNPDGVSTGKRDHTWEMLNRHNALTLGALTKDMVGEPEVTTVLLIYGDDV